MTFFWISEILCEFFGTTFNTTKLVIVDIYIYIYIYIYILNIFRFYKIVKEILESLQSTRIRLTSS